MTLRRIGTTALGLAAGATLASAGAAHAATVLATGTLTGPNATPARGEVRAYGWPDSSRAMDLPLLGTATSARDGRYSVLANDEQRLLQLARKREGWLDFTAVADVSGREGEWTFTAFVSSAGGRLRVVPSKVASAGRSLAGLSAFSSAPQIDLRAQRARPLRASASAAASASSSRRCESKRQVTDPVYTREWAVIGELNNAYNDGTWARFRYGRAQGADTEFGVAASYAGSTWTIGGTNSITDEGTATFPTVRKRYSRRLRTKFEFKKQSARNNTCAVWDTYITATSWLGGNNDDLRVVNGLDRCDRSLAAPWTANAKFLRNREHAVRYDYGVEAFGVNLTTQSGYSDGVTVEYGFKGSSTKKHFLCGPNGRQSPFSSGRILSGGVR